MTEAHPEERLIDISEYPPTGRPSTASLQLSAAGWTSRNIIVKGDGRTHPRVLPHRSRRPKGIAMINLDDLEDAIRDWRAPRPLRRDDHRVSTRAPAL
jgi:hypothetical protein